MVKRSIMPHGRVGVLKSLILSNIIYPWTLLPNPQDNFVDALQKTVFYLVWSGKQGKISRKTAI